MVHVSEGRDLKQGILSSVLRLSYPVLGVARIFQLLELLR